MAQYSKIIDGQFKSTGVNKPLYFPCVPDMIEIWNLTQWATTTNHHVVSAVGFQSQTGIASPGTYVTESQGTTWLGKIVTVNGITFFSAGSYSFGASQAMSGAFATAASPVNITVTGHGYNTGDVVWVYGTTSMLQIAGIPYVITKVDANNFTIPVSGGGFASASTAGNVKQLLYPDLYIPELCYITAVTAANPAVITTSINHNFVVGQEVGFTIPSQWGMVQLDSANYLAANNGIPQQAYVTAVSANTVTVNVNSSGFTAFAYPTSATAALGMSFPQIYAIGDGNTGYSLNSSGQVPYLGITNGVIGIPGSFAANTRQGVIVGTGDGTEIIHANNDIVKYRALFPDLISNQ